MVSFAGTSASLRGVKVLGADDPELVERLRNLETKGGEKMRRWVSVLVLACAVGIALCGLAAADDECHWYYPNRAVYFEGYGLVCAYDGPGCTECYNNQGGFCIMNGLGFCKPCPCNPIP